jgi:hypothetical protein
VIPSIRTNAFKVAARDEETTPATVVVILRHLFDPQKSADRRLTVTISCLTYCQAAKVTAEVKRIAPTPDTSLGRAVVLVSKIWIAKTVIETAFSTGGTLQINYTTTGLIILHALEPSSSCARSHRSERPGIFSPMDAMQSLGIFRPLPYSPNERDLYNAVPPFCCPRRCDIPAVTEQRISGSDIARPGRSRQKIVAESKRKLGVIQDDGGQQRDELTVSTTLRFLARGRGTSAPLDSSDASYRQAMRRYLFPTRRRLLSDC